MNPQWLMAIASLLGAGGGLFFRDRGTADLLKLLRQYTSPDALSQNADAFYNQWLQSPSYSMAQRNIMAGQRGIESSAAQSLAARGLNTSGIGAITGAVGSNVGGFQMGQLQSAGREAAMRQAMEAAQMMIGGARGLQPPQNTGANVYAGALDAISKMFGLIGARGQGGPGMQPQFRPGYGPQMPNWMQGLGPNPYGSRAADYFELLSQAPFGVMGR